MHMWASAQQNQQNDLCAQQRLGSAWASCQSDQSSLFAWRLGSLATLKPHGKDWSLGTDHWADTQADLSLRWEQGHVNFVVLRRNSSLYRYGYINHIHIMSIVSGVGIFCFGFGLTFYNGVIGLITPQIIEAADLTGVNIHSELCQNLACLEPTRDSQQETILYKSFLIGQMFSNVLDKCNSHPKKCFIILACLYEVQEELL